MKTEVLQRISLDHEQRVKRISTDLDIYKDWELLNRVLALHPDDCFALFNKINVSLEDVENLISLLDNCLKDDSTLTTTTIGYGIFARTFLTWGNDEERAVYESDVLRLIDILERRREFYNLNEKELNRTLIKDRNLLREYHAFTQEFTDLMKSL